MKPALLAMVACLTIVPSVTRSAEVTATPIEYQQPFITVAGNATFSGAIRFNLPANRQGGISGLETSPDGKRVWAITDRREWIEFSPQFQEGRLTGITNGQFAQTKISAKFEPESLALTTTHLYVGTERTPAILSFPIQNGDVDTTKEPAVWLPPEAMKNQLMKPQAKGRRAIAGNFGLESLTPSAKGLYAWQDASLSYETPIPMWELRGAPNFIPQQSGFDPVASQKEADKPVLFRKAIRVTGAATVSTDVYLLERTYYTETEETRARVSRLVAKDGLFTCQSVLLIRSKAKPAIENLEALTVFTHTGVKYAMIASDDIEDGSPPGTPVLMCFRL